MIDIHTHILPGVDDGARTMEESLTMLKEFAQHGVKAVFATSHVAANRGYANHYSELKTRYDDLVKLKNAANIDIDLYLGSEIDERSNLIDLIKQSPTMNNSSYVLIDFGMRRADIHEIVYELKIQGYQTIIAHPERYTYIDVEDIKQFKREGALIQVSVSHITKEGHKAANKFAKQLLKEDLIDFVATDAHRMNNNKDQMKRAYAIVTKKKGEAYANAIFHDNAKRLLIDHE